MNVAMADDLLQAAQVALKQDKATTAIEEVNEVAEAIFTSDGLIDVMWLNSGKCAFKLVALNLMGLHPNDLISIQMISNQITSSDEITDVINANVSFDNSRITFEVINNINALLNVCGDDATMQRLFEIVLDQIKAFERTPNNNDFYDDSDSMLLNQHIQEQGTKRVQKLLIKYKLDDHTPYIFEAGEEPTINIKRLESWANRNRIIVSVHRNENMVTCNIDQCYLDLYKIIFNK